MRDAPRLCLAILVLFIVPYMVHAQVLRESDLHAILGKWSGTVAYVAVDDSTKGVTEATFIADTSGGRLNVQVEYDGANERRVEEEQWQVTDDGRKLLIGDKKWTITTKRESDRGKVIGYQTFGEDNGRRAQLMRGVYISTTDSLIYTKSVLYENSGREFVREHYRLGRAGN